MAAEAAAVVAAAAKASYSTMLQPDALTRQLNAVERKKKLADKRRSGMAAMWLIGSWVMM